MSKVFVTGANGFIGSNLCRYLLDQGWDVVGLVRPGSDLHFLEGLDVHLVRGDLAEPQRLEIPRDIDYLVHSASIVTDLANEEQSRARIYQLTVNLAERLCQLGIRPKKLVYISTALTLGFNGLDISESRPGQSALYLPYVRFKKKSEEFLLDRQRQESLPAVVLRPGDVYGPNDRTSCALMLRTCERHIPLIAGHGNWQFPFCYIDNLCQAVLRAFQKPGSQGCAYTVTNRFLPTWREFFSGLQAGIGRRQRLYVPVAFGYGVAFFQSLLSAVFPPFKQVITAYRIKRITTATTYDISRTFAELDYQPDEDLGKQIRAIVDWYCRERREGYIR